MSSWRPGWHLTCSGTCSPLPLPANARQVWWDLQGLATSMSLRMLTLYAACTRGPQITLLPGSFLNPHWSWGLRRLGEHPPRHLLELVLCSNSPNGDNKVLASSAGGWPDTPLPLTLKLKSQDFSHIHKTLSFLQHAPQGFHREWRDWSRQDLREMPCTSIAMTTTDPHEETCPRAASSPAGSTWSTVEGNAALGFLNKVTHMRSSGPGPKSTLSGGWGWGQAGKNPRPGSRGEGALWTAGGWPQCWAPWGGYPQPQQEPLAADCCPPDGDWAQPKGGWQAARGRQGWSLGLWWGWVDFQQPVPCGAASLKGQRWGVLVSGRGTTLGVVCACVLSWLED